MRLIDIPVKFPLPFAGLGAKNVIPEASQIGITPGAASLTDGFPPLTRTPLAAGGVPPAGLDMNGILFESTAVGRWANAGGGYPFDNTFATDANVGGYPKGARILRTDGLGYWLNTTDNNITDPEGAGAAAAGWVPDYTYGIAPVTMTNVNVTLTPLQWGRPVIVITGLLTGNLNLIFPLIVGQWVVVNNTTGSFTVTAKTASGTGIVVSGIQHILGDSVNIYSFTNTAPTVAQSLQGFYTNLKGNAPGGASVATYSADAITTGNGSGGSQNTFAWTGTVTLTSSGAGGLDTGSVAANTWYAVYAITKADNTQSYIASTNFTSPTLPSGYINWALISTILTDSSSHIIKFLQVGPRIAEAEQMIFTAIAGVLSLTSQSIAAAVPPNAKTVSGIIGRTSGSQTVGVASDSTGTGYQLFGPFASNPIDSYAAMGSFNSLLMGTTQTIYWVSGATDSTHRLSITAYTI